MHAAVLRQPAGHGLEEPQRHGLLRGLRNRQLDVAGARALSTESGHAGRARVSGGAAGDHDGARLELGAVARTVRDEVEHPIGDQACQGAAGRIAGNADLDHLDAAGVEGARRDVESDLRPVERRGGVGHEEPGWGRAGLPGA